MNLWPSDINGTSVFNREMIVHVSTRDPASEAWFPTPSYMDNLSEPAAPL